MKICKKKKFAFFIIIKYKVFDILMNNVMHKIILELIKCFDSDGNIQKLYLIF